MNRFVLFSDRKKWELEWKRGEGSLKTLLLSLVGDGNWGEDNPIACFDHHGTVAAGAETGTLMVIWEPYREATYGRQLIEIKQQMSLLLNAGDAVFLLLHSGSDRALRKEQAWFFEDASNRRECLYHHEPNGPYHRFCSVLAACGTPEFKSELRSLTEWFDPPHVPAYQILLELLPDYLEGKPVTQLPVSVEWARLDSAMGTQNIKADIQHRIDSESGDGYRTLCRAMTELVQRREI